MKPRRPAVKDSRQKASREGLKRKKRAAALAKAEKKKAKSGAGLEPAFAPVEIRGEPLSATILEERRQ